MKIYSGKQKVGTLEKQVDLVIDFDDFFYYQSKRRSVTQIQQIMGLFFILTGFIFFVTYALILIQLYNRVLLLALLDNRFPSYELFPSLGTLLLLYAWYLLRNRNRFGERFEQRNLVDLKRDIEDKTVNEVEIENYFSDNVSAYLEEGYKNHNDNFIFFLSQVLLQQYEIKQIIASRIPLNIEKLEKDLMSEISALTFDENFQECFLVLFQNGLKLDAEYIDEYVMFAAFADKYWRNALQNQNITTESISSIASWIRNNQKIEVFHKKWRWISKLKPTGSINRSYTSKATPYINKYGIDYVKNVIDNGFVFSLNKEEVINNILNLLTKENSPNVLITGESGVGKTHLVKNIATLMVAEDVPDKLKDKRLIIIDINRILTQVASIDAVEKIISKIFNESEEAKNCILVFENIEYVFEIREENRKEILNRLVTYLEESKNPVIASANTESFNKILKQNNSFGSLFEIISISETDIETSIQILLEHVPEIEEQHEIKIEESGVRRIVESSIKIHSNKAMPDKAIELLEEVVTYTKGEKLEFIDANVVDQMIEHKLGFKIGDINKDERETLVNLEKLLHQRIVGQNRAVEAVAAALKRARAGLNKKNRPVASFLFFGPTGVGKTEIAKALAESYFGHESKMIRIDMSEYSEEKNLERLVGIENEKGEFQGGFLTDQVKKNPFSLILFDEIEKANPKVLDLFLQILDEGSITDGAGKKIDFTQSIIIMTSNAGSKQIAEGIFGGKSYREVSREAFSLLQNSFRIELLNRFDKIIMFKPLNLSEIHLIVEKFMHKLNEEMSEQGIIIQWDNQTINDLSHLGFNPIYGAREISRTIQDNIKDKIASLIVEEKVKKGQSVHFKGLEISDIV